MAGLLSIVSWNCTTLSPLDHCHFLHDKTTLPGKADIILLQETRILHDMMHNIHNPLLHPHATFQPQPHLSMLSSDTGIIICHTDWAIEDVVHMQRSTHARMCIPDSSPAVGDDIHLLHIWSIHAPPTLSEFESFWCEDIARFLQLNTITSSNAAAIVGSDWNAVPCLHTDVYPSGTSTRLLPLDIFDLAGLLSWAWMLKKQEGHWFIWKEHRYRRAS